MPDLTRTSNVYHVYTRYEPLLYWYAHSERKYHNWLALSLEILTNDQGDHRRSLTEPSDKPSLDSGRQEVSLSQIEEILIDPSAQNREESQGCYRAMRTSTNAIPRQQHAPPEYQLSPSFDFMIRPCWHLRQLATMWTRRCTNNRWHPQPKSWLQREVEPFFFVYTGPRKCRQDVDKSWIAISTKIIIPQYRISMARHQ
jgi:hypothetical protein